MMKLYESVRVKGDMVIFEFKNEKDARVFKELVESPKTDPEIKTFEWTKIERRDRWVALTFLTSEEARLVHAICERPKQYEYNPHPLESQGKRCKHCG